MGFLEALKRHIFQTYKTRKKGPITSPAVLDRCQDITKICHLYGFSHIKKLPGVCHFESFQNPEKIAGGLYISKKFF